MPITMIYQQSALPCTCQQKYGDVMLWFAAVFIIIVALDVIGGWRRKRKDSKTNGAGAVSDGDDKTCDPKS